MIAMLSWSWKPFDPFDLNTPMTVNDFPPISDLLADERGAVGLLAEQVLHVGEAEHDDVARAGRTAVG